MKFIAAIGEQWMESSEQRAVISGQMMGVGRRLYASNDNFIKFCERKRDDSLNSLALPGDLLKALIDRRVEIFFPTFVANPGRHVFNVNCLPSITEARQDAPLFHFSFAEFTSIAFHNALPLFFRIRCDYQDCA